MRFTRIALDAAVGQISELAVFYGDLGLGVTRPSVDRVAIPVGETALELRGVTGSPFYHFAILVPGNRFDAALEWARERTTLLPSPGSADGVFDFDFWDARACYFHDPVGNIVELIAHRGVAETAATGPFHAGELVGVSELGLVGDRRELARPLSETLGIELWSGSLGAPDGLAFVGERARTFILSPIGRGWLPTGRPAEPHPVEAVLAGGVSGSVRLEGGLYSIFSEAD